MLSRVNLIKVVIPLMLDHRRFKTNDLDPLKLKILQPIIYDKLFTWSCKAIL